MDQNDSEADEKDHAQRRAAERMAPKQEMRQQSAQHKNKKCDDQWVAHGGSRCLQKPDHLAASPVMLCAALILNPDRWGRQPAHRQALDRTRVHAPVASRTAISPDGPWEAAGVRAGGDRPREWPLHGPAPGARCGRSAGRSGSARRSILARVRPFESWKAVEDKLNADYERLKQENPKRAGNLENERKRALTDLRGLKDRLLHQDAQSDPALRPDDAAPRSDAVDPWLGAQEGGGRQLPGRAVCGSVRGDSARFQGVRQDPDGAAGRNR